MKNHPQNSFLNSRRVIAATIAVALTTALPGFAQAGGSTSPSTTGSTANETARRNSQTSPTPGADYQSKAATADVDSTVDVNTRHAANGISTGRDKLSWGDRRFVTKAADGGQTEVQLAQLAAQRATNPDVKSFAQKLVDDHTKVNSELVSLAGQKSIKVDTDDDKDRSYKRLNKKTGADFDQEFVEHMIDEHEKAIKMFEKASNDAKDADVRSFAAKHVGHLREHLQQAQSLRQAVMPTGRIDESSGRSSSAPGTTSGSSTTDSTLRPKTTR